MLNDFSHGIACDYGGMVHPERGDAAGIEGDDVVRQYRVVGHSTQTADAPHRVLLRDLEIYVSELGAQFFGDQFHGAIIP